MHFTFKTPVGFEQIITYPEVDDDTNRRFTLNYPTKPFTKYTEVLVESIIKNGFDHTYDEVIIDSWILPYLSKLEELGFYKLYIYPNLLWSVINLDQYVLKQDDLVFLKKEISDLLDILNILLASFSPIDLFSHEEELDKDAFFEVTDDLENAIKYKFTYLLWMIDRAIDKDLSIKNWSFL